MDQTYWYCEQLQTISQVSTKTGSDQNHRSILGDSGLETVRRAVSLDLTVKFKDSEQSLVCSKKMLQFIDFRAEERLLVPTLLKDDGLEVDPNTVLSTS